MKSKVKKYLIRLFCQNIKIKILCLIIASLAWIFVSSSQSLMGKFPNQINVDVLNLNPKYSAFLDNESVNIYIMAENSAWQSITSDSFSASVDVSGLLEGTYDLEVRVSSNMPDVKITKIEPSHIFVNIDKIVTKTLSISPKIDGDPIDGMIVGDITLNPETVEISGPSSLLKLINEAQAIVKLNGESSSFSREVKVSAVSENSTEANGIVFNPETVLADITITKGGNSKSVGVKLSTVNSLPQGLFISKITFMPAVVDITGQRSVLSSVNYIETENLDLATITNNQSVSLKLSLPQGVSLQKDSPLRVSTIIEISNTNETITAVPAVTYKNLASGLQVLTINPAEVIIYLSGSITETNSFNNKNVKLLLDLSNLTEGTHEIVVNKEMVQGISPLEFIGATPQSINITISK